MESNGKRVLLVRPNYAVSAAVLERTVARMNAEMRDGLVVVLPPEWKATVIQVDGIVKENS
jgi:hypothetical protein